MITERTINKEIEKKIVTGMIVSSPFCRDIMPMLRLEYFDVDYARNVAGWIKSYYGRYKKAPGIHIQDIFNAKKIKMKEEVSELVGSFLLDLSEKYSLGEEGPFNSDYLVDQAQQYFKRQAMLRTTEITRGLLLDGKVEEAEREWAKYKGIYKEVSKWVNPFSPEFVEKVLEEEGQGLFSFPGKLGELTGPWKRGWLVSFMGPRKRGKSWFLMEVALWAVLSGLKVAFFSLEMLDTGLGGRILTRMTSLAKQGGIFYYPVFDCVKNQDGTCNKKERINKVTLLIEGKKPSIDLTSKNYKPCLMCRGRRDYSVANWWVSMDREKLSFNKAMEKLKGFETMYGLGDKFRLMTYPPLRANLSTIEGDLEKIEEFEGFVPDLIIMDYADILRPEVGEEITIESTGQTWIALKSLAADRKCCVITATQTNRKSGDKKNVRGTDVAWDIRKMDHIDLGYALSQTPYEKQEGVMRVGVAYFRWGDSDENKHVVVLQNLEMGVSVLDSEFGRFGEGKE